VERWLARAVHDLPIPKIMLSLVVTQAKVFKVIRAKLSTEDLVGGFSWKLEDGIEFLLDDFPGGS